jgi:hypothetical protein
MPSTRSVVGMAIRFAHAYAATPRKHATPLSTWPSKGHYVYFHSPVLCLLAVRSTQGAAAGIDTKVDWPPEIAILRDPYAGPPCRQFA